MNIRKLKDGRFSARVYIGRDAGGKMIRKTVTGSSKKDVEKKAALLDITISNQTVGFAVKEYLAIKQPVLSPATYRSYSCMYRNHIAPAPISAVSIDALTPSIVQRWISTMAAQTSAKTTKNVYGLFTAAVNLQAPDLHFHTKLPQRKAAALHTPTTEEVSKVLEYAREHDFEAYKGILLAAVGMMRCGEICALTAEDIDRKRNTVRINKSQCRTAGGEHVIKPPKTESSNRIVVLPEFVIEQLPRKGKVVEYTSSLLSNRFIKISSRCDVPHFRFHDLRHYAASIAASSSVNISLESIKARGGWSTDSMMKRVYINQIGDVVDKDTETINAFYTSVFGTENGTNGGTKVAQRGQIGTKVAQKKAPKTE